MKKILTITAAFLITMSLFSCGMPQSVKKPSEISSQTVSETASTPTFEPIETQTDREDMKFSQAELDVIAVADKIFTETYGFEDLSLFYVSIMNLTDKYFISYHLSFLGINTDEHYSIYLDKNMELLETRAYGEGDFSKYIGDDAFISALSSAKRKIENQTAKYNETNNFYFLETDGYLCLCSEIIVDIDPPKYETDEDGNSYGGCGIDHDHLFFTENICPIN